MGSSVPILDNLPVGFRFRPRDEELVNHYLNLKLQGHHSSVQIIPELDLCKVEPWDVPDFSVIKSDDPEWFFFSPPDYKYSKSKRLNRTTKCGFWKSTGNDRYIRLKGTNKVIGTKKTLVFYEGRVPNGVKSCWVIHEYHAVTFDESQRTFVLCRLMKKANKKAEGGVDTVTFDEGETSGHMASDIENQAIEEELPDFGGLPEMNMESIFKAPQEFEGHFASSEQSPMFTEQDASVSNSPLSDAYFRNDNSVMQSPSETIENDNSFMQSPFETTGHVNSILQSPFETTRNSDNIMQSPFETIEEEDEFVNSMLADSDFGIVEEIRHAFVNNSTQSKSLRSVYYESSHAEAEVVSSRLKCGNMPDTSTLCDEHPSYLASKVLKSSQAAGRGLTCLLSSNHEAEKERNESIFQDDLLGVGASSCDSTADIPLEINCIEISSPSMLRRWKNQSTERNVTRRSQKQRKVSRSAVSHLEANKKNAQNTSSREHFETRSHREGFFIFMETPSSSQSPFPRSVYLVNVVIGILLFIVTIWEVLSLRV